MMYIHLTLNYMMHNSYLNMIYILFHLDNDYFDIQYIYFLLWNMLHNLLFLLNKDNIFHLLRNNHFDMLYKK